MKKGLTDRFYDLARDLRSAQTRYFKQRKKEILQESKDLEKKMRESLAWLKNNRGKVTGKLPEKVEKMLDGQQQYYRTKRHRDLVAAKIKEANVDKDLADHYDTQTALDL